ncbi:MAG: hypothetical protein HKO90_02700, partial [Flavobacteriaceae bacterium]|nr:hypothetical protein [Flavobacteriaceae bacterium]
VPIQDENEDGIIVGKVKNDIDGSTPESYTLVMELTPPAAAGNPVDISIDPKLRPNPKQ